METAPSLASLEPVTQPVEVPLLESFSDRPDWFPDQYPPNLTMNHTSAQEAVACLVRMLAAAERRNKELLRLLAHIRLGMQPEGAITIEGGSGADRFSVLAWRGSGETIHLVSL